MFCIGSPALLHRAKVFTKRCSQNLRKGGRVKICRRHGREKQKCLLFWFMTSAGMLGVPLPIILIILEIFTPLVGA